MNKQSQWLCAVYLTVAIIALIACWSQNFYYVGEGFWAGTRHFWQDTFANPASRSITIDIFLFNLSAAIWMIQESKKHNIKNVWAYLVFGLLIAISVTFPLFLIVRELKIAHQTSSKS